MSRDRAQPRSQNGPSPSRPGGSLRLGLCCAFVKQPIHSRRTTARYVSGLKPGEAGKFGRLDVLVNNAGVAEWMNDDLATFRRTLEANVFGVVAVTYALLPLLNDSPAGRIVNHSSALGSLTSITNAPEEVANFLNPAYTTSKAALNGFTVALAHKLRGTSVKVNSAHPGWVKTDLGSDAAPMEVVDGAQTAVTLATLPGDGPTGRFFHMGEQLPW